MRYASVCDGIGAAHVAWQSLGWQCAWTSEIEPFPAAVVEQRFGYPNVGDMTQITEEMLNGYGPVDLLVGGTPCQSFSVAGLRGGLADPRGNLALRFVQLASVLKPEWIVWENVPGVLSSGKGRDFGTFLGALGELGYGFAYRVLDAQWFGVAQRRRRVFVVAHARDWRRAAAVLFERESVFGDSPTRGAAWQGVTAAAASCAGVCGEQPYKVANCLTRRMHKGINTTCDEGQTPVLAPQAFYSNESRCDNIPPPDIAPPVKVGSGGSGNPPAVAFKPSHYTRGKDGKPSEVTPPLSADADKGDQDTVVAAPFVKAKRAQSTTDDESWVPGEVAPTFNCFDQGDTRATTVVAYDVHGTLAKKGASETDVHTALRGRTPGQSEASTTTVVAFTQNSRDEVRQINGDGQIAGALSAEAGMHQTNYIAQAFTHSGYSNQPAWITGDRTDCLPSSGHGVMQPVGFNSDQSEKTRSMGERVEQSLTLRAGKTVSVAIPMAVRRLTPRECERLQGFPDDYTAITYRNKQAADGPRYRA